MFKNAAGRPAGDTRDLSLLQMTSSICPAAESLNAFLKLQPHRSSPAAAVTSLESRKMTRETSQLGTTRPPSSEAPLTKLMETLSSNVHGACRHYEQLKMRKFQGITTRIFKEKHTCKGSEMQRKNDCSSRTEMDPEQMLSVVKLNEISLWAETFYSYFHHSFMFLLRSLQR